MIERRRVKQMPKATKETEKRQKEASVKVMASGILDENNARIMEIGIPGRGTVKIKITFEKEEDKINLAL